MKHLKGLEIIVPPLKLQTEFIAVKAKVKTLRKNQEGSAYQTKRLFNSLLSKAFKGELVTEVN